MFGDFFRTVEENACYICGKAQKGSVLSRDGKSFGQACFNNLLKREDLRFKLNPVRSYEKCSVCGSRFLSTINNICFHNVCCACCSVSYVHRKCPLEVSTNGINSSDSS